MFDHLDQFGVQKVGTRIIVLRGDGAINGHGFHVPVKKLVVALILLFTSLMASRAPFIKFIDGDDVGKIQHVNFSSWVAAPYSGSSHTSKDPNDR